MSSPFLLALLFVGSACLYLFLVVKSVRMSSKQRFSRFWLPLLLAGAAISGVTLALTLPALSQDITVYMAIGRAGKSYFTTGFATPAAVAPVLYGPTWVAIATTITGGGSQHLAAAMWLFRGLALLSHLLNTLLIWAILGKIAPENRLSGTMVYAWNPLALIELAVNGNASGVVICLLLLAMWLLIERKGLWFESGALALVGLASSINLLALLLAPLLLWFLVRDARNSSRALVGFAWRALVVLAVVVAIYIPVWQGGKTFLAITASLRLFDFANSPLSLAVMPVGALYSVVAQSAHFPPSLMQPTSSADATIFASAFFLFVLLYFREMGRVRKSEAVSPLPGGSSINELRHETQGAEDMAIVQGADMATIQGGGKPRPYPIRSGPLRRSRVGAWACPRPGADGLAGGLAGGGPGRAQSRPYEPLFTGWGIILTGYIVLAAPIFWPWYGVWLIGVAALRRFDALNRCVLLLSCTALLYYPLLQLDAAYTTVLVPVCIFGISLVYLIAQRFLHASGVERNSVPV